MQHALISARASHGASLSVGSSPRCSVMVLRPGVFQVNLSVGPAPRQSKVTAVFDLRPKVTRGLSSAAFISGENLVRLGARRHVTSWRPRGCGQVCASLLPSEAVTETLQVIADPSIRQPVFQLAADVAGSSEAATQLLTYLLTVVEEQPETAAPYVASTIASLAYANATPSALSGIFDYVAPIQRPQKFSAKEVKVGRQMGEGNFGVVYEGFFSNGKTGREQKWEQHVVLKRIKSRVDCAEEMRDVELYMNHKVQRAAPGISAEFLGTMMVEEGETYGKLQEGLWLVWNYQGDRTLEKLLQNRSYPNNIARNLLGVELSDKKGSGKEVAKWVEWEVAQVVIRQILQDLQALHRAGIVHRDIKPSNMILDEKNGKFCLIDLGACVDLRTGHNFVPNETVMDPKYAAPERFVMPPGTSLPYPPDPLASLVSPFIWALNTPDRFDMYSAGIVFMQLCVKQLRYDPGLAAFNKEIKRADYDLGKWRKVQKRISEAELAVLDAHDGAGWNLASQLLRKRHNEEHAYWPSGVLGEGRPSAAQALRNRFFSLSVPEEYRRYAGLVDVKAKKAAREEAAAKAKAAGPQTRKEKSKKKDKAEKVERKKRNEQHEGAMMMPTVSGPFADALGAVVMAATGVTQQTEEASTPKGKASPETKPDAHVSEGFFAFLNQPTKEDGMGKSGAAIPTSPRKQQAKEQQNATGKTGLEQGHSQGFFSFLNQPVRQDDASTPTAPSKQQAKAQEPEETGVEVSRNWWGVGLKTSAEGKEGGDPTQKEKGEKGDKGEKGEKGDKGEKGSKKGVKGTQESLSVDASLQGQGKKGRKEDDTERVEASTPVTSKRTPFWALSFGEVGKEEEKEGNEENEGKEEKEEKGKKGKEKQSDRENNGGAGKVGPRVPAAKAREEVEEKGGQPEKRKGEEVLKPKAEQEAKGKASSKAPAVDVREGAAAAALTAGTRAGLNGALSPTPLAPSSARESTANGTAHRDGPWWTILLPGGAGGGGHHQQKREAEPAILSAKGRLASAAVGAPATVAVTVMASEDGEAEEELKAASPAEASEPSQVASASKGNSQGSAPQVPPTGGTQEETAIVSWDAASPPLDSGEGQASEVRPNVSEGTAASKAELKGGTSGAAIGAREEPDGSERKGENEPEEGVKSPMRYISAIVDLYFGKRKPQDEEKQAVGDAGEGPTKPQTDPVTADSTASKSSTGTSSDEGSRVLSSMEQDVGQLQGLAGAIELVPSTRAGGSLSMSLDPSLQAKKPSLPSTIGVPASQDLRKTQVVSAAPVALSTSSAVQQHGECGEQQPGLVGEGTSGEEETEGEGSMREESGSAWAVTEGERAKVEEQLMQLAEKYAERDQLSKTLQQAVTELDQQIGALELSVKGGRNLAEEQKKLLEKLASLLHEGSPGKRGAPK